MRDKKFERNLKWYMVMFLITFIGYIIALFTIYPRSAIVGKDFHLSGCLY